jgi:hypothetical protein
MAEALAPRSMAEIKFWTPPTVLLLTVGGGGGGGGLESLLNVALRSTVQRQAHRWTADDIFRTPPTGLLLTGGGGVQNEMVFWQAPPLTWQESIAPDSHHLPQTILPLTIYHFSDIPPSSRDIIFHYLLLMVPSHNSVSPFPLLTHHRSLHHCWSSINTLHVTRSYSSLIFYLPSHAPKDPLAIYYRLTYPLAC